MASLLIYRACDRRHTISNLMLGKRPVGGCTTLHSRPADFPQRQHFHHWLPQQHIHDGYLEQLSGTRERVVISGVQEKGSDWSEKEKQLHSIINPPISYLFLSLPFLLPWGNIDFVYHHLCATQIMLYDIYMYIYPSLVPRCSGASYRLQYT